MEQLPTLAQLLKQLQQVPYLASKNLYRVAHHFLEMDAPRLEQFCRALTEVQARLVKCSVCYAWQERDRGCAYCTSIKRDQNIVCVVETWHDLYAIEKTGGYTGVYHVLGGVICPLDGVGPEDLSIDSLIKRIQSCTEIREVILAMNQTPEGEATAAFIGRKLNGCAVKVTCLSRGIPVGSSLEAMDRLTVFKALAERRLF